MLDQLASYRSIEGPESQSHFRDLGLGGRKGGRCLNVVAMLSQLHLPLQPSHELRKVSRSLLRCSLCLSTPPSAMWLTGSWISHLDRPLREQLWLELPTLESLMHPSHAMSKDKSIRI
jgi:hypothetical protein